MFLRVEGRRKSQGSRVEGRKKAESQGSRVESQKSPVAFFLALDPRLLTLDLVLVFVLALPLGGAKCAP